MYKGQLEQLSVAAPGTLAASQRFSLAVTFRSFDNRHSAADELVGPCRLYTSDAADEPPCVEQGGRRIIKKKKPSTDTR